VGARAGSPLVLGVGQGGAEHFVASDAMALAGVTDQIIYLEEGDLVDLQPGRYWIVGPAGRPLTPQERPVRTVQAFSGAVELGPYRHYMQKKFSSSRARSLTRSRAWRASCPSCSTALRSRAARTKPRGACSRRSTAC